VRKIRIYIYITYLLHKTRAVVSVIAWIYNYLWNQCLSPLMQWVRISIRAKCTTSCDKVCQWLATWRSVVFSSFFQQ